MGKFAASWRSCFSLAVVLASSGRAQTYTISTFAGGGAPSTVPTAVCALYGPRSVTIDVTGNLYFADGQAVLRLDGKTGMVTRVAGRGDPGFSGDNGLATEARLNAPAGVVVDGAGNLYIADSGNSRIRKVTDGVITTTAGGGSSGDNGLAINAQLSFPYGLTVDSAGNLYIADQNDHRVRKVSGGVITTAAGNGTMGFSGDGQTAATAQLASPSGVAVDAVGNLYIADSGNGRIRRVSGGVISTIAGGGQEGGDEGEAANARLDSPQGLAFGPDAGLYVADYAASRVRKIAGDVITTVAGGVNIFGGALAGPTGVAIDSSGNLYIAEFVNARIRKVANGGFSTVAGGGCQGESGPVANVKLTQPSGVAIHPDGSVYIADQKFVLKVSNGVITTVAGAAGIGIPFDGQPANDIGLQRAESVGFDKAGNLYIGDSGWGRVLRVSDGVITNIAGGGTSFAESGPATSAAIFVSGMTVGPDGSVYLLDSSRVRRVSGGIISTIAGNGKPGFGGDGGPATRASLNFGLFTGIAVGPTGDVYVADTYNHRIRRISEGIISTIAGNGTQGFSGDGGTATSAQLSTPQGVALDLAGNLYISDRGNGRVRKVLGGIITTIAGSGSGVTLGDGGPALNASLSFVLGLAAGPDGNVYVSDAGTSRVLLLTPAPAARIAPNGIVPNGSSIPVIAPDSWVSIYGSNLASGTFVWNGEFPTLLGDVTVTINGRPAYLWMVSPTQINLQTPDDASVGLVEVLVKTPAGTATGNVTLALYAPALSLLPDGRHVVGQIATPNGSGAYSSGTYDLVGPLNAFSYPTRPVKAGETLTLYGTGFGPTNPPTTAGHVLFGAYPTATPVSVTIGGVTANVSFSGLTQAGLCQLNLTVPAGVGSGDKAIVATVGGVRTPDGVVVTTQ